METPLNTHENVAMEALPTGRRHGGCTRGIFALCGVMILTGVFLLGYAASYWDASGMVKRLLLRSRQPKETLKIALCQYNTRINNLPWNLGHAIALAEEAFEQGAHYVILPEFSFSGMTELRSLHKLIAA